MESRKLSRFVVMGVLVFGMMVMLTTQGSRAETLRVGEGLDPEVPGNYNTISAAISDSQEGDVIRVESGVYDENVYLSSNRILIGAGNQTRIMGGWVNPYAGSAIVGFYIDSVIYLYGDNVKIINCEINRHIRAHKNRSGTLIENCIIREGFYDSYSLYDAVVVGCEIYKEIYDIHDSTFIGNRIHIDENCSMVINGNSTVVNNLITYAGTTEYNWLGLDVQNAATVEHNTFVTAVDLPTPATLWKNNIIYTADTAAIDEQGNLTGDPLFEDMDNDDYHLAAGSPAIDAGLGVDSDGSPADIGMYGGVRNTIWNPIVEEAGKPVVGHLVVTPNPIAPGEPLRIRFTARSTP